MSLDATIFLKPLGSTTYMAPMQVKIDDVSKNGIGFSCKEPLQTGTTYEASLKLWTNDTLEVFLQIVRSTREGSRYSYGAIFIGMSDVDAGRIAIYQSFLEAGEDG